MADTSGARAVVLLEQVRVDLERTRAEGSRRGDSLELIRVRLDAIDGAVERLAELEQRRADREAAKDSESLEWHRWLRGLASRDVIVPLVAAALSVAATQFEGLRSCAGVLQQQTAATEAPHVPAP